MEYFVTMVMYEPSVTNFGQITLKRTGITTKQFNQLPVKGTIIRNGNRLWRTDEVIIDANSNSVEIHLVRQESVVPSPTA